MNYVGNVLKEYGGNAWEPRDVTDTRFVWAFPNQAPVTAKDGGERGLRLMPVERLGVP